MTTEYKEIEVYVAWDEDGAYNISQSCINLAVEGLIDIGASQTVSSAKIKIKVPLPKAHEVTTEIKQEDIKTIEVKNG